MSKEISTRIFNRSDTAANWAANNPILGMGEIGYETDTGYIKIGNGTDHWNDLNYPFSINTVPIGSISLFAGETAPDKWLFCRGQVLKKADYPELFEVIGTTYGDYGDEYFGIPNLCGKVPVGLHSGQNEFNTLGETGGEKTHTLTINEMPEHSHTVVSYASSSSQYSRKLLYGPANTSYQPGNVNTSTAGKGYAHNNLQPYITLNYIIYAGV